MAFPERPEKEEAINSIIMPLSNQSLQSALPWKAEETNQNIVFLIKIL